MNYHSLSSLVRPLRVTPKALYREARRSCICIFLFFIATMHAHTESADYTFPVRVLLTKTDENSPLNWSLYSPQGFVVEDLHDRSMREEILNETIVISLKNGKLALNGRRCASSKIRLISRDGYIKYEGCEYQGDMLVVMHDKAIHLINSVDLEDYIFSVVRWEGWPGWPLEVNRVFAIMCRTYVVNKVLIERKKKRIFDIKNTNIHQTYKGVHSADHLRQALEDTRGVVMTHKGAPIEAMYDACCGGVIPALMQGVDFEKAPYLKRAYGCPYCKKTKIYAWQTEYSVTALSELLAQELGNAKITQIYVSKKDKAGVVQELVVKTKLGMHTFPIKKIYALIKNIRSLCFDVIKKGKKIIFKGRGYGHHLGICQWGVRQMVREGWHYLEILKFYYIGVSFMNIQVVEGA